MDGPLLSPDPNPLFITGNVDVVTSLALMIIFNTELVFLKNGRKP